LLIAAFEGFDALVLYMVSEQAWHQIAALLVMNYRSIACMYYKRCWINVLDVDPMSASTEHGLRTCVVLVKSNPCYNPPPPCQRLCIPKLHGRQNRNNNAAIRRLLPAEVAQQACF
jgi:hypothetical protein